jgi:hypothetical protein
MPTSTLVQLRNDSGATISMGSFSIGAGQTEDIWDTVGYTAGVADNFQAILDFPANFNEGIGSSDLVMVQDSSDLTSTQAWALFHVLQTEYYALGYDSTGFFSPASSVAVDGLVEIVETTQEPTGYDPTGSEGHPTTLSIVDGTRTFTITPTGSDFEVWVKGKKLTVTGPLSVVWPNTEGFHAFAIDSTGTLIESSDISTVEQWILGNAAITAALYWNADDSETIAFLEERHGHMNGEAHLHFHNGWGMQWYGGGEITDLSLDGDGTLASHAQLGFNTVRVADEDLRFVHSDGNPQTIAVPAQVPIYYRLGADGFWRRKASDTYPLIYSGTAGYTGASGRIPYNADAAQTGISFVDVETNSVSATSITLDVPAGVQDDDLLVIVVTHSESEDNVFTTPAGWTLLVDELQVGGTPPSIPGTSIYYRVASSEPANYTVTGTFSSGILGALLAYRGVDTTTPFDTTETTDTGTGAPPNPPPITTASDNALVVAVGFKDSGGITSTSVGYNERTVLSTGTGGNGSTLGICDLLLGSSASEDPGPFSSDADEWGAVTLALRPQASVAADWQLFEASEGAYVLMHYWTSNDLVEPFCGFQGQNQYFTLEDATEAAAGEILSIRGRVDLLGPEYTPLGTVIFRTESGYTNAVKAIAVTTSEGDSYLDARGNTRRTAGSGSGSGGGGVTDHGNLTGLGDDDHAQYALLGGRAGGQTLTGGSDASDDLTLRSTSDAARGLVNIDDDVALLDGNEFRLYETGSVNYVGFVAPTLTGNQIWVLPDADGADGQSLTTNGAGTLRWDSAAGSGDVVGPASATDNAIARYDTTTGKLLQNSSVTIDDDGNMFLDASGSSEVSPRVFGAINFGPGAIRWEFGDDSNGIQNSFGGSMSLHAFHTIILRGDRDIIGPPAFDTESGIGVWIDNTNANSPALVIDGTVAQNADLLQLRDGNGTPLSWFDSVGNFNLNDLEIQGIAYSPTNYTETADTLNGHLEGIDTALGTTVRRDSVLFTLTEDVNNTTRYFHYARSPANDNPNPKRSGANAGLQNANTVSPYQVPYNATIVGAVLTLKGAGVQNGSVTYPVTYQTDLNLIDFTNDSTNLAAVNFSISNSFTVGTFSVGNTNYTGSVGPLSIDVDEGQMIGIEFINGGGPSIVGQTRNAFLTLLLEER